jgi:hypothetical protein
MITKALFSELLYDSQSERWTEFELPKLSLGELQALCKLLGCPCYGTKETLVVRLLAQRALRLKLAPFTDNAAELAASMRREALRGYSAFSWISRLTACSSLLVCDVWRTVGGVSTSR